MSEPWSRFRKSRSIVSGSCITWALLSYLNKAQLFATLDKSQQTQTMPPKPQIINRRGESTHYLHKGKWVKRKRF